MSGGLKISGLYAAHGTTEVLHGIDLAVPEHTLACIVGPSGGGKSTLLRAIAGFHRPTRGSIELNGRILDQSPQRHLPAERRNVGYIPQDGALFPHLSVAANIGFGLPRGSRSARVTQLLELTDLDRFARRHPHELSGGQQQRVALARALAPEPDVLLLDEPFSALDASLRARVRSDVIDLLRTAGTTAILVTHDANEALAFGDLITVITDGRALQTGTPEQLHDQPDSAAVARTLGEANIFDTVVEGNRVETPIGRLSLRPQPSSGIRATAVLIRPRQISVHERPGTNGVPGHVLRTSFHGTDHRIELSVEGCERPVIAYTPHRLAIGATVYLSVTGTAHPLSG